MCSYAQIETYKKCANVYDNEIVYIAKEILLTGK